VAEAATQFKLLGDQPHHGTDDPLGFDRLTDRLARVVLDSRSSTPFTLGIEASWGMGKSTLMARLRKRLKQEEGVETVWFNAWRADESGVLEGLVKTVLNEMDANVLRRALRNRQLVSWLRFAVSVAAGFFGLSNAVDQLWSKVEGDPRARNQLRGLVEDAVEAWRKDREDVPVGRTLCVFIDDLDRCTPEGVLEVFEAMKVYMDVEGFVFIVGYDRDIVAELVNEKKSYSEAIKAQDYLEKIIQITYRIPRSSPDQSKALLESCLATSRTSDLLSEESERTLVVERNARNPRRIKRFINGFVLSYGLDDEWKEFPPESLIRVQLLYMYFKAFSDLLHRPSERDPAQEFVEYFRAREVLRRRTGEWELVRTAFESHELPPPPADASPDVFVSILAELEAQIPEPFVPLAAEDGFASLVESLAAAEEWPPLRERLAEGAPPVVVSTDTGAAAVPEAHAPLPTGALFGLSVLWVDDAPENNREYVELLRAAGAGVETVTDTEQCRAALERGQVNVLISDIGRGERTEAGLEDLEAWRAAGLAPRTVLFFTSRVTPARRDAAARLGAGVVSDPGELIARVTLASVEDPTARRVLESMLDSTWEFRTAKGLAEQAELPIEQVQAILDAYPHVVRRSPVPDRSGDELFALRSKSQSVA
jgi:CheY-like chemotaxis protein